MKKWSVKISGIAVMAGLFCLMTMGAAGAFDQADLDRLLATNSCNNCNLSRADLTGGQYGPTAGHATGAPVANVSEAFGPSVTINYNFLKE